MAVRYAQSRCQEYEKRAGLSAATFSDFVELRPEALSFTLIALHLFNQRGAAHATAKKHLQEKVTLYHVGRGRCVLEPCSEGVLAGIGDRVKPLTLKVAVYEGDEPVTNVETVTFDSASGDMDERQKWVHLVLRDCQYDKTIHYRLVLRDLDTGIEQASVDVMIDRAFTDDF